MTIAADVLVVGAGPAGAAAAIELANAGRDVVVVDRATFPRDKCCGDGLTTAALRRLEGLGVDPRGLPSSVTVDEAVLHTPAGRTHRMPLPTGRGAYGVVVERLELDAALVARARDVGATVHEGTKIAGIERHHGHVDVILDGSGPGRIAAHYVVAADGMWSPTRKLLAPTPGAGSSRLGEWHAMRQYVGDTGPRARQLHIWFEPDLIPGYAWSFPLAGDRANFGFGTLRDASRPTGEMAQRWAEVIDRTHIRAVLGPHARFEGSVRAWPIPTAIGQVALTALQGRVLFVGDAAAAADPLTGEGIGQALLTGHLAADAVLAAGALAPRTAAARYRTNVERELVPDDGLARWLGSVLNDRHRTEAVFALAGATDWTRRNVARWMFEDYPRAFVATPSRWRDHSLQGAGAWSTS